MTMTRKPKSARRHRSANRKARDEVELARGFLPIPAVAKMLGLSQARVYELAGGGTFEVERVGGSVYVHRVSAEAYRKSLAPGRGWIPIAEAASLFNFARTTLIYRARRGEFEMKLVNKRAYLYRPALEAALGPK
jgi:hypothetical protein